MKNYKIKVVYDGSRYKGWQRLSGEIKTIQFKIEEILSKFLEEEIKIIGASRTDAGVHSKGQIANFYTNVDINIKTFIKEINEKLPEDIAIVNIEEVDERFHSRYNAKLKRYSYTINHGKFLDPFSRKYTLFVKDKINVSKMREAAVYFCGEHDFSTFTNAKSKKKSMVREIYRIDVFEDKEWVRIEIRGNGFLHNMVRRIVGVLIMVGMGDTKTSEIIEMLNSEKRDMVKYIADAKGLCLEEVYYK